MRVSCVRCNKVFESLVIEPETAWKDIFTALSKHMANEHPKFHRRVVETAAKAQMIIASYLVITEEVKNVEENKWLDEHLENLRDIIMHSLGYEPVDDDEEEENKEEEIEEENNKEEEIPVFEETD